MHPTNQFPPKNGLTARKNFLHPLPPPPKKKIRVPLKKLNTWLSPQKLLYLLNDKFVSICKYLPNNLTFLRENPFWAHLKGQVSLLADTFLCLPKNQCFILVRMLKSYILDVSWIWLTYFCIRKYQLVFVCGAFFPYQLIFFLYWTRLLFSSSEIFLYLLCSYCCYFLFLLWSMINSFHKAFL